MINTLSSVDRERAERIMDGKGTLNELKVCSHEIAASTAQLVVSSQVKAHKDSAKLGELKTSAKKVKNATAEVVASSNFGEQMIEEAGKRKGDSYACLKCPNLNVRFSARCAELRRRMSSRPSS